MPMKKNRFLLKITLANLKKNKVHTIFTVISTVLCIILIFALSHYFYTSIYNDYNFAVSSNGSWLYQYTDMSDALETKLSKIVTVKQTTVEGLYGSYQLNDEYMIELLNYSDFELCPQYIYQGRHPQNDQEALVSRQFIEETGHQIGDMLSLTYQDADTQETKNCELEIVGIMQFRGTRTDTGLTIDKIIRLSQEPTSMYTVYVATEQMDEATMNRVEGCLYGDTTGASLNNYVVARQYLGEPVYNIDAFDMTILIVIAFLFFVMFITIYNQFLVTLKHRKHYYGLLLSMGANHKHLKIVTVLESFFYALIGIFIGLIVGYYATKMLYDITTDIYLKTSFNSFPAPFITSPEICIIISLMIIVIMNISTLSALKKIYRENIVDLIKENVQHKKRHSKTQTILLKSKKTWLSLGLRYPRLEKGKYLSVIITMILSISFFNIASYYFNVQDQYKDQKNDSDNIKVILKHYDPNNPDYDYQKVIEKLNQYNPDNRNLVQIDGIDLGELRNFDNDVFTEEYKEAFGVPERENISLSFTGVDETLFKDVTGQDQPIFLNRKIKNNGIRNEEDIPIFKEGVIPIEMINSYIVEDEFFYERQTLNIYAKGMYTFEDFEIRDMNEDYLSDDNHLSIEVLAPYDVLIQYNQQYQHLENNLMNIEYKMYTNQHEELIEMIESDKELSDYILAIDNPLEESSKTFLQYFVEILTIFIFLVCLANLGIVISSNIVERSQDYAVLKSLGIKYQDMKKMIYTENILLSVIALCLSMPIVFGIEGWMFYFKFTDLHRFIPSYQVFLSMTLALIIMSILISEIILRTINKDSIISSVDKSMY